MKWLATTALCLAAFTATAQEAPYDNRAIGVICGAESPANVLKEEYGELGMLQGEANVLGKGPDLIAGMMQMYVNPETKSFTIVFQAEENLYCMLTSGNNLTPFTTEQGI